MACKSLLGIHPLQSLQRVPTASNPVCPGTRICAQPKANDEHLIHSRCTQSPSPATLSAASRPEIIVHVEASMRAVGRDAVPEPDHESLPKSVSDMACGCRYWPRTDKKSCRPAIQATSSPFEGAVSISKVRRVPGSRKWCRKYLNEKRVQHKGRGRKKKETTKKNQGERKIR
jgi:hypothetical protein